LSGIIQIRLSGEARDLDRVLELLREHADQYNQSTAYPNRRDPGVRIYITMTARP